MTVRVKYSLFLAVFCAVPGRTSAQVEAASSAMDLDKSTYYVDAMSFSSPAPGASRLDVFVQVPYDQIGFVRRGEDYYGSYDVTIAIHDSSTHLISEKLWTEEVKGVSFDQSVSPRAYSLTERVFDVVPGKYFITTIVRDNEIKEPRRLLRQIDIPDYTTPGLQFSDIMLVSKLTRVGEKRSIVPSVSSNVGALGEPFHVFFETYSDKQLDSIRLVATVLDQNKARKLTIDTVVTIHSGKDQLFLRVDHSTLPLGDYTIFVQAFPPEQPAGEDPRSLASTSRSFVIRWFGMPRSIRDLDVAIDQLQYIAKDNELSRIKEGETAEERQKRFIDFWKTRDPNPNTPRNEKMEEYYSRVDYANKHFKHYLEGWKTDMGMVFIIFGSPNNVERHPFDIDSKPYEVWSYYELNHSFVFVDMTGFGDYRLTTPIWEVWQRQRD